MTRLANGEYLYLLLIIPFILLLYYTMRRWKTKRIKQIGDRNIVVRLFQSVSTTKPLLKLIIISLALVFMVVGIANPQIGSKLEEVKREGVDIIIALDISNSMKAEDIKPNRLERSKQAISRLIDKLQNDRIGLVVFAGKAYTQLPLTTDFAAAKLFLSTVNSDIIPTQGTAIGDAIKVSSLSMEKKDNKYKVLIIITDGENHEDNALEEVKAATEQGIIIHTIGMGSVEGGPIPIYNPYGTRTGFLKDNAGNVVVTKLDASMLQQIAAAGKGKFIRATNADDGLTTVLNDISKMEKKNFGTKVFTDYEDRFQYFIGIAFLLLCVELFINERKSKWWEKMNLFGTGTK